MSAYKATVNLPQELVDIFDAIRGVATIDHIDFESNLVEVTFEDDDDFDLGALWVELNNELRTLRYDISCTRPAPVVDLGGPTP